MNSFFNFRFTVNLYDNNDEDYVIQTENLRNKKAAIQTALRLNKQNPNCYCKIYNELKPNQNPIIIGTPDKFKN